MRVHSIKTIEEIRKLRREGCSINSLVSKFSISKTTIWHHIQGIKLSADKQAVLRRAGGRLSRERKLTAIKTAGERAVAALNGKDRSAYCTLASLYWAEGSKGRCEFVNTDGKMIELYLHILRETLKVPEEKIVAVIRTFSGQDENKSLLFWSKVTKIPKSKIRAYRNDGGNNGRTQYGMCRIAVLRGGEVLKLLKALADRMHLEITN